MTSPFREDRGPYYFTSGLQSHRCLFNDNLVKGSGSAPGTIPGGRKGRPQVVVEDENPATPLSRRKLEKKTIRLQKFPQDGKSK